MFIIKKITALLFTFMLYVPVTQAQTNTVTGEYSLTGVMETATAFQLKQDSTFAFYFSYGALDRYGSGTWTIRGNDIILNSKPYSGKDFRITERKHSNNSKTIIVIKDPNTALLSLVYCKVKTPTGDSVFGADNKGIITIPYVVDSFILLSDLCPERSTSFQEGGQSNYFVVHFEQWIIEVFFTAFHLRYMGDQLTGDHPILDHKEYTYKKEQ